MQNGKPIKRTSDVKQFKTMNKVKTKLEHVFTPNGKKLRFFHTGYYIKIDKCCIFISLN